MTLALGKVIALSDRIVENEHNSIDVLDELNEESGVGMAQEGLRSRFSFGLEVTVSAPLYPSEDPSKVLEAVDLVFGGVIPNRAHSVGGAVVVPMPAIRPLRRSTSRQGPG